MLPTKLMCVTRNLPTKTWSTLFAVLLFCVAIVISDHGHAQLKQQAPKFTDDTITQIKVAPSTEKTIDVPSWDLVPPPANRAVQKNQPPFPILQQLVPPRVARTQDLADLAIPTDLIKPTKPVPPTSDPAALADIAIPGGKPIAAPARPTTPQAANDAASMADLAIPSTTPQPTLAPQLAPTPQPTFAPQPNTASQKLLAPSALNPALGSNSSTVGLPAKQPEKNTLPTFFAPPEYAPTFDNCARPAPFQNQDFLSAPLSPVPVDPLRESLIYRGKFPVEVQRPWVEFWRPLYTGGIYPPAKTWFGETNPMAPHFMVYGDLRTGVGVNRNSVGDARSWATRLNLDMDLKLTSTERFHCFMGPLDRGGDFTRLDFSNSNNIEFVNRTDLRLDTGFFEGDMGALLGGLQGTPAPFDLPFTVGLMPLIFQNGVWLEDAMIGGAFAIPARNSPSLGWANFDATFFAASDQITSDAFQGDNNAAQLLGTAWFIDAYEGYIEADYAFVHDDVGQNRSYHNIGAAFTRRYLTRLSNSIRFIGNFGQNRSSDQRTADGYLILLENSLITSYPNTFVPYANFFYGSGRPQSVARAAGSGGILRNTGINFESDGLTGYSTLDATGNNTYGMALGVNLLGNNFRDQLVLEAAMLGATGSPQFRVAPGDQYATGIRYQRPLSYRWLFRTDAMYGWQRNTEDVFGTRFEFRWKF